MIAELWHRILSAELNPLKSRELAQVLGSRLISSYAELRALSLFSDIERARMDGANERSLRTFLKDGGWFLEPDAFPETLLSVSHPPLALYGMGDATCLTSPLIAIVGTRRAGGYGRAVAKLFAAEFALAGATVISGGAYGIDAAAHEAALENGRTCAVLFTGADKVYPLDHRGLFERIKGSGCLLSQFALGTVGDRQFRPLARNRIIAALASAVVIVECPLRSGAMSTATEAAEQDRPVFVVPGMIDNLNFEGSHRLIREGAHLTDHPHQVLEYLGIPPGKKKEKTVTGNVHHLLMEHLTTDLLSTEVLASRTGLDHGVVLSELTVMELDGLVAREQGKYRKTL